ncbi:MAG: ABC transporter permease [Armatimonadetes bacterium]|nr:ABC transporter permease [Armatimonadota bacterium]
MSSVRRFLRRHLRGAVGGALFAAVLACAALAPWIVPHPPGEQQLLGRLRPPAWAARGDRAHLLGTDHLGRDLASRILFGARTSLLIAGSGVMVAGLVGVTLGIVAGYRGGAADLVLMRLVDVVLAFPALLLAIALLAAFRPSAASVVGVLTVTGWVTYCRIVRGQILVLKQEDFVVAVHALGGTDRRLVIHHLLPNLVPVILVIATIQLAQFILAESALSFLGLGVPPAVPSWGGMINEGRDYIWNAWWIETFPGLAIVWTVSGIGLLGDWLRDLIDPRLRV